MLIAPIWTVKGRPTFKFDVHFPRDSPDMTPYKISEKGAWPESHDRLNFTWQICALSVLVIIKITL